MRDHQPIPSKLKPLESTYGKLEGFMLREDLWSVEEKGESLVNYGRVRIIEGCCVFLEAYPRPNSNKGESFGEECLTTGCP
jgi:hypothetical protein